jgi:hypothetical protein
MTRIVDRRRIPTNPQDGAAQLVSRIGQAVDELKAALPAGRVDCRDWASAALAQSIQPPVC